MTACFADSYYYIALLNPRDSAHARATDVARKLSRAVLTTEWVLTEVANVLSAPERRGVVASFLAALRKTRGVEVLPASADQFEGGLRLYADRPDKSWSLTDCISFVTMTGHGLREALTGDHHFEQAGFRALLK